MTRYYLVAALAGISLALSAIAQDQPAEEGFTSLFDGKSNDGWQGGKDGYLIKEGALVCQPKGSGNLYTEKEYGDFHLKFEFKLTPGANNGIGLRVPLKGDPAYV